MPEVTLSERIRLIYTNYFGFWAWVIVAVIVGGGFWLVIYPLWVQIQATGAFQYNEISMTQAARQNELDELKVMRDRLHDMNQSQLLYVEDTLPADITPAALMEQVANTFIAQGLTVQSIDVVDATAEAVTAATAGKSTTVSSATAATALPGIRQLQLTVNIAGDTSYEGLKQFLQVVASSNPILELYSVAYSIERKSFSIVFTTYVAD